MPGAALALVSALCFGAFFVAMNAATDEAGAVWAVALNRSTSVAVLLVAMAIVRPRVRLHRADLRGRRRRRRCSTAPPTRCSRSPSRRALTSTVSVLGSLYTVTTVVLAALLLDERVARRQAAGLTTVLAGIALVSAHA